MRQAVFEAHHVAGWQRFEAWLDRNDRLRRREPGAVAEPVDALADAEVPQAYRRVCSISRSRATGSTAPSPSTGLTSPPPAAPNRRNAPGPPAGLARAPESFSP